MRTFDEQKERDAQDGSEWQFGAIQTDLALIPIEERIKYLPEGVLQFNQIMDSNGCASRAPLNILESKFTYFYDHGMHPDNKAWLIKNGYVKHDRVVFDDNFIEILSGTTPQGNSLKTPIDTIRKVGLIPKTLSMDGLTWEQYMDPKRITDDMLKLGKEFLRRFTIGYEQVQNFPEALNEDFLSMAGYAWPEPVDGVYPRTAGDFNHAFAGINTKINVFDNYLPYVKLLAKDYNFFPWGYSLSITSQNPYPDETIALFDVLSKFGLLAFFSEAWKRLFSSPVSPTVISLFTPEYPTEKPVETVPTKQDKIKKLVETVKIFEGWIPRNGMDASGKVYPNGSRSWRNNNPINAVFHFGQYNPIYGKVKSDGRFAVFATPEKGHLYAENFFRNICTGQSDTYNAIAKQKGYKDSSELSIAETMHVFAPKFENDTKRYLDFISSRFGVPSTTKMSYFVG